MTLVSRIGLPIVGNTELAMTRDGKAVAEIIWVLLLVCGLPALICRLSLRYGLWLIPANADGSGWSEWAGFGLLVGGVCLALWAFGGLAYEAANRDYWEER